MPVVRFRPLKKAKSMNFSAPLMSGTMERCQAKNRKPAVHRRSWKRMVRRPSARSQASSSARFHQAAARLDRGQRADADPHRGGHLGREAAQPRHVGQQQDSEDLGERVAVRRAPAEQREGQRQRQPPQPLEQSPPQYERPHSEHDLGRERTSHMWIPWAIQRRCRGAVGEPEPLPLPRLCLDLLLTSERHRANFREAQAQAKAQAQAGGRKSPVRETDRGSSRIRRRGGGAGLAARPAPFRPQRGRAARRGRSSPRRARC